MISEQQEYISNCAFCWGSEVVKGYIYSCFKANASTVTSILSNTKGSQILTLVDLMDLVLIDNILY